MSDDPIQKAWDSSRVILVAGDDGQSRLEAVRKLASLAATDGDMDLEQVVADAVSVGDWFGKAGTCPFMSDHRTLVVRNVCRVALEKDQQATVCAWASSLPSSARLILVADEEAGDDDRRDRDKRALGAWTEVVKAAKGTTLSFALPTRDISGQVQARVKKLGHTMSKGTAETLVAMVGGKADSAFAELEKLSLMVGEGETVTADHLRQMVTPDPDFNRFKLAVAVVEGSSGEALRHLSAMMGRTKDKTGEALSNLFPAVTRQIRLVWQARAAIELGSNIGHASPQLKSCLMERPNLAAEKDFVQQQALRLARRTTFDRLARCYMEVVKAESQLKGQEAGASAMETLEQMVLRMCAA